MKYYFAPEQHEVRLMTYDFAGRWVRGGFGARVVPEVIVAYKDNDGIDYESWVGEDWDEGYFKFFFPTRQHAESFIEDLNALYR